MAGSGSFIHVQSSLFAIINNLSYLHLHLHLAFYSPTSCCINLWSSNLPKLPNLDVLHMQNSPTSAFSLGFQPFPAIPGLGARQNRHLPEAGGAASCGPGGLDPNPVLSAWPRSLWPLWPLWPQRGDLEGSSTSGTGGSPQGTQGEGQS